MPREDIAQFTIESVQVLSEDRTVDEELLPSLTDEQLLSLYEHMKRSRRLDERAIALQRRGELGKRQPRSGVQLPWPTTTGSFRPSASNPHS